MVPGSATVRVGGAGQRPESLDHPLALGHRRHQGPEDMKSTSGW